MSGSERIIKNKSTINRSLDTFEKIVALNGQREKLIPYRDSKLTRLVTNAFKKDTQLALIATLSPVN